MPVVKAPLRYGTVAMSLHWLIAAAVIANLCIGLYMADLPRADPSKFELIALHKSIGLTVLALSVLRVVWRLVNPVPLPPPGLAPWLKFAGRAVHFLLYFLIVAIPLAGWLMVSVGSMGHPTPVFGLFGWPSFPILADMSRAAGHPYHEAFETISCLAGLERDRANSAPRRRRALSPIRTARRRAGPHGARNPYPRERMRGIRAQRLRQWRTRRRSASI